MSTSDGGVIGTTQIFGSAPRTHAFTVVLMADGFTDAQQNDFNTACDNFAMALTGTPPFNEVAAGINIFRVNVRSTDSGADDPTSAGGTGATARTYFDSTFGLSGIRRALGCNGATALTVAAAQVPEFDVALVVVNSAIYGGTGGGVGTYSLAPGATEIAIHETGHTAFGFADEYAYLKGDGDPGRDHHPAGKPWAPNVTLNTDRATLKWGWAVAGETALPTLSNGNCALEDGSASPVAAGTVGLFEGADTYRCDAYRPEYNCKMRALGQPFCAVCRQVIYDRLRPFTVAPTLREVFANGDGTVYAVMDDGDLLWYRHDGREDGTFRWAPNSGSKVGVGWNVKQVFGGGDGVIYAITLTGDLLWFRHDGRFDGTFRWAPGAGNKVGAGWDFKRVFSGDDGVIYAVTDAGDLFWYRHDGPRTARSAGPRARGTRWAPAGSSSGCSPATTG